MTFVAGASASIMKTLREIEAILEGEDLLVAGPKRSALREKLQSTLIKSSKTWYRKGFNRGHKEAYVSFKERGIVPNTLQVKVEREFLPNAKRSLKLRSTLTKSFRERHPTGHSKGTRE